MQQSDVRALIKPYFSDLSETELHSLLSICEFKSYDTKSIILKAGNRSKNAFLVLEGSVRGFVMDENGEEKNILLRSKGIFVGDADALFTDEPQKLTIMSIDSTKILMFSINSFEALAFQYAGIQRLYMSSLKEAILRLTYRVNSMITMNSEQRYLDLLEMNPDFLKGAYDKYVANYLGITAVSFSRIKKKLNKKLS